jgi:hypothetical protein
MYHIKSGIDKPDFMFLLEELEGIVKGKGLRLSNKIFEIKDKLSKDVSSFNALIVSQYNINNPNSSAQILKYMGENLDYDLLEICRDEKTGKLSSSKENLAELSKLGCAFAIDILNYRKYKKQLEYVEGLLGNCDRFGRIFPNIDLGATNRVNYTDPPLMNIPKEILWDVLTPRVDGNYLVSVDIKNQEPTVLINWKNIECLKAKLTSERGLYFEIFVEIFNKEPNDLELKELKTAWLALNYGATKIGIKNICSLIDGEAVYDYFNSIKEIKRYTGEAYGLSKAKCRVAYTYFGTKLNLSARDVNSLKRQHLDFPIQGTCSDILSMLVKRFRWYINTYNLKDVLSIYYTRHDELIIEVDKTFYEKRNASKDEKDHINCLLGDILNHKVDDWVEFKTKITLVKGE